MAWEKNNRWKPRYVIKERIRGKVMSKVFRTEEEARAYKQTKRSEKEPVLQMIAKEQSLEDALALLERLINQIFEQDMICRGYIQRHGAWQEVKRLNKPLTPEESRMFRRIKSKAVPCPGFQPWTPKGCRLASVPENESTSSYQPCPSLVADLCSLTPKNAVLQK